MELLVTMLPALAVLVVALASGAWVARVLVRRAPADAPGDALDDADEKLARAMTHLRELKLQRERLAASEYERQLAELERRAADAMKERDDVVAARERASTPAPAAPSAATGVLAGKPALRGALWGAAAMAVMGGLFLFVSSEQKPAAPDAGGVMTTKTAMPAFFTAETPDEAEAQGLLARLRAQPGDVAAAVRLGHILVVARMVDEAQVLTARALQLAPENGEALVHAAALRSLTDKDGAVSQLDRVLGADPKLAEGWLIRGMIGMHAGDGTLMRESFVKFADTAPDGAEREHVRSMLARMASAAEPSPKP